MRKIWIFFILYMCAKSVMAHNIASVDPNKILDNSQAWKAIRLEISTYANTVQQQVIKRQQNLEQQWLDIKTLRNSDNDKQDLVKKEKIFMEQSSELQAFVQSSKDKMEKQYIDAKRTIQQKIFAIVKEISEKENYELVLTETDSSFNSPYMYIKPNMSLNTQVIKILNTRLPKITINLESNTNE